MPSEILRVSIFISYLRKFYGARNLLFSKVTKKFSWTYTLEFWAEIFSQYSPLKVEEHNVPSEFRSDAWFMRKKIVSILKKSHCRHKDTCMKSIRPLYHIDKKGRPYSTLTGKWVDLIPTLQKSIFWGVDLRIPSLNQLDLCTTSTKKVDLFQSYKVDLITTL